MASTPNLLRTPAQRWERYRTALGYGLLVLWLTCLSGFAVYFYRAESPADRKILAQIQQLSRQVHAIHTSEIFVVEDQQKFWGLLQQILDRLPSPQQPALPPGADDPGRQQAPKCTPQPEPEP